MGFIRKGLLVEHLKYWKEMVEKFNNPKWVKKYVEAEIKRYERKIAKAEEQLKEDKEWYNI